MKSSEQSELFSFIMNVDMCFRSKDGSKLIHSRTFKYLSGHYFFTIAKNNKTPRTLIVDLVYESGELNMTITDIVSGEVKKLDNPVTGKYEFAIESEHSYKIEVVTKKAVGKYSFRIK